MQSQKARQTPGYLAGLAGVAAGWFVAGVLFEQGDADLIAICIAIGVCAAAVTSVLAPRSRSAQWTLLGLGALALLRIAFIIFIGPFNAFIVLMAAAITLIVMQFIPWRVVPAVLAIAAPAYVLIDSAITQRDREQKQEANMRLIEGQYAESFRKRFLSRMLVDSKVQWIVPTGRTVSTIPEVSIDGVMRRGSVKINANPYHATFTIRLNVAPPFDAGPQGDEEARRRELSAWLHKQGIQAEKFELGSLYAKSDWEFSMAGLYYGYLRDKRDHIIIEGSDANPLQTIKSP